MSHACSDTLAPGTDALQCHVSSEDHQRLMARLVPHASCFRLLLLASMGAISSLVPVVNSPGCHHKHYDN
eukprot:5784619-Amphidinium_carterae.1